MSLLSPKGQEGGPGELQTSQAYLDTYEGDGTTDPGNHLQVHE